MGNLSQYVFWDSLKLFDKYLQGSFWPYYEQSNISGFIEAIMIICLFFVKSSEFFLTLLLSYVMLLYQYFIMFCLNLSHPPDFNILTKPLSRFSELFKIIYCVNLKTYLVFHILNHKYFSKNARKIIWTNNSIFLLFSITISINNLV